MAPAELDAISVKHPKVAHAAVIGVLAERYGGKEADGKLPKAFIIRMKDSCVTNDEIAPWFIAGALYKAVSPDCIESVDSLPKVPSGKILRKDLRAREQQSWPLRMRRLQCSVRSRYRPPLFKPTACLFWPSA